MSRLSGRESSVLALLARSRTLSKDEKRRLVEELEGEAKEIARVLVGQSRPSPSANKAAQGFTDWAKGL
jgi:hypothetical protein